MRTYVWGGAIKIGATPFWGRHWLNIGYLKSFTPHLIHLTLIKKSIFFYIFLI